MVKIVDQALTAYTTELTTHDEVSSIPAKKLKQSRKVNRIRGLEKCISF